MQTTTLLAVIALCISGLTFLWTIAWSVYTHRRATRPSLTVSTSFAIPIYGADLGEQSISVTVANTGTVPTTVTAVLFEIRGSQKTLVPLEWVFQDPRPLPVVLSSGERWQGMVTLDGITASLRQQFGTDSQRIRAVARDAARSYTADGWLTV